MCLIHFKTEQILSNFTFQLPVQREVQAVWLPPEGQPPAHLERVQDPGGLPPELSANAVIDLNLDMYKVIMKY